MTTTDQRTQLVMSKATLHALSARASLVPPGTPGRRALDAAIARRESLSFGRWRVPCDEPALAFIREHAPEIARMWPAVFGDVAVPRAATIIEIANRAPGQVVAGLTVINGQLRLSFESGDALLIGREARIEWRTA